jgi:hypothetical protein
MAKLVIKNKGRLIGHNCTVLWNDMDITNDLISLTLLLAQDDIITAEIVIEVDDLDIDINSLLQLTAYLETKEKVAA